MNIKILGTGCPSCKTLEQNTIKAISELGIDAKIEKITDIEKIMDYGVMSLPVLIANDKILTLGFVASVEEIKKLIKESKSDPNCSFDCSSCPHSH
mgnify:CR=1 FL=1